MSTFKVGDLAIGCNYVTLPDRNGMECEITEPLALVTAIEQRSGIATTKFRYGVRWADGLESYAQQHTLQRPARQLMLECLERAKRLQCEVGT